MRYIWVISQEYHRNISGIFYAYLSYIFQKSKGNFKEIPDIYLSNLRHILGDSNIQGFIEMTL